MKIQRLTDILAKAQTQFPNAEVYIEDGDIVLELSETPTQAQIDAVPNSEYEEFNVFGRIHRLIKIFRD